MLVLTACAAVFVAAEYALTTLERVQVERHLQEVGDRRAQQIARAQHSLSFQLSGAQLGITITTLATGYLAEPSIAGLLRPVLTGIGLPDGAEWIVVQLPGAHTGEAPTDPTGLAYGKAPPRRKEPAKT